MQTINRLSYEILEIISLKNTVIYMYMYTSAANCASNDLYTCIATVLADLFLFQYVFCLPFMSSCQAITLKQYQHLCSPTHHALLRRRNERLCPEQKMIQKQQPESTAWNSHSQFSRHPETHIKEWFLKLLTTKQLLGLVLTLFGQLTLMAHKPYGSCRFETHDLNMRNLALKTVLR